jgi:hypothetical protein
MILRQWPRREGEKQPMKLTVISNQDLGNGVPQAQRGEGWMRPPAEPCAGDASCPQTSPGAHRPKRRADLRVRLIEGEAVVLDRRAGLIHQLNHTASYIWDRCHGEFTAAEIADQLQSRSAGLSGLGWAPCCCTRRHPIPPPSGRHSGHFCAART